MLFNSNYSLDGKENIKEEFQKDDYYIIANVSEDKILDVINHFSVLNKDEKMFLILECPCDEQKEIELNKKIAKKEGKSFDGHILFKLHKDIYYADGLGFEHIIGIINENFDMFRNNGLISFGVGCHESNDEIMIEPYNIVTIFSKQIDQYSEFYKAHDIKECKNIKTAWNLIQASNPGVKTVSNDGNGDIYSFIRKMEKEVGLYLAETREEEC